MKSARVLAGMLVGGLLAINGSGLQAQVLPHSIEEMEWRMLNLRPTGQPVIPMFDGWMDRDDGTYDLCFGYFNLNLEQSLDIPLGPDNFMEPASFNGLQPTHFQPVPEFFRRYFCVFTVNVPADFGDQRVVWTLRIDGRTYSVPGHTGVHSYRIDDMAQPSRNVVAPVVRFIEPAGPEARGRTGVKAGPLTARVGTPVPVTISARNPEGGEGQRFRVLWAKHQGPGEVTFSSSQIEYGPEDNQVTTQAIFSEPGEYVLGLQVLDGGPGSFGFQCCWTNGYVQVNVAP